MQLLSQSMALTAIPDALAHTRLPEFFQREEVRHLAKLYLTVMILGQLANIPCLWVASKAVAFPDRATLLNAAKVWGLNLLLGCAVVTVNYFTLPLLAEMNGLQDIRALLIAGGMSIFTILLVFLIPMKVYVIGFFRAVGLLILALILLAVASTGLSFIILTVLGGTKDIATLQTSFGKTPAEQSSFMNRLLGHEPPDELERLLEDAAHPIGPQPPLAEREATIRKIQQKLAARRATLPPGNPIVQNTFRDQLSRYLRLLNDVMAERKAQPAGSAGH